MKDEDKAKDQLIKELQKMRGKVAELEKVKLKYNQMDKKLKQAYKKLVKFIEVIAQEMKLPQDKIEGTRIASLVHDIGKVNLPTEIISKPGKLIDVEFNLIKNYPKVGCDILRKVDFPWPIAEIVLQHQEKIDGSGYPRGLKGDEICIEAKILGVANVVEAMSSYKSYRPALSIDEALAEIAENKNILFDLEVVDTCIKLFKEKEFKF